MAGGIAMRDRYCIRLRSYVKKISSTVVIAWCARGRQHAIRRRHMTDSLVETTDRKLIELAFATHGYQVDDAHSIERPFFADGLSKGDAHIISVYSLYRDYIKHEVSLINNRLTWLIAINGCLYAAYGIMQSLYQQEGSTAIASVIVAVGLAISLSIRNSLSGAVESLENISRLADKHLPQKQERDRYNRNVKVVPLNSGCSLPGVVGGGLGKVGHFRSAYLVPNILIASWVLLALCILFRAIA